MRNINFYEVFVPQQSFDYFGKKLEPYFKQKVVVVIAENKRFCIIEDSHFTKITKDKDWKFGYDFLNKHSINSRKSDVLGSGIIYRLYSEKKKRSSTIQKELKEYIDRQYSIYLTVSDLSFIK